MSGSNSLCSISCKSIDPTKASYGAIDWGKDIYDFIIQKTGIQTDRTVNIYISQNNWTPMYIWTQEQQLMFAPELKVNIVRRNSDINIKKVVIPFEDIIDFSQVGELYREQIISGGGDDGINLAGAVAGGLLFGTAGAIIGSRNEIKEVKSETLEHDSRNKKSLVGDLDATTSRQILKKLGIYKIFPAIKDDYYMCQCGAVNRISSNVCFSCGQTKNQTEELINEGFTSFLLKEYIKRYPAVYSVENSIDENIKKYILPVIEACKEYDKFDEQTFIKQISKLYKKSIPEIPKKKKSVFNKSEESVRFYIK